MCGGELKSDRLDPRPPQPPRLPLGTPTRLRTRPTIAEIELHEGVLKILHKGVDGPRVWVSVHVHARHGTEAVLRTAGTRAQIKRTAKGRHATCFGGVTQTCPTTPSPFGEYRSIRRNLMSKPLQGLLCLKSVDHGAVAPSSDRRQRHCKHCNVREHAYSLLVGVAGITIYNWESEKARPRAKQLAAWGAVRRTGKREALRRLELLG